jgi:hypothetical protein
MIAALEINRSALLTASAVPVIFCRPALDRPMAQAEARCPSGIVYVFFCLGLAFLSAAARLSDRLSASGPTARCADESSHRSSARLSSLR